jgi:hypothetical protein
MTLKKIEEAELEALIDDEQYVVQGTMTICTLELASGFKLVGTSACLNDDDFNDTIGRQVARQKAFDRLWELEGYHRKATAHAEQNCEA